MFAATQHFKARCVKNRLWFNANNPSCESSETDAHTLTAVS